MIFSMSAADAAVSSFIVRVEITSKLAAGNLSKFPSKPSSYLVFRKSHAYSGSRADTVNQFVPSGVTGTGGDTWIALTI
jgi:hypothetical protein